MVAELPRPQECENKMADLQVGPLNERFVDKRRGRGTSTTVVAEVASFNDLNALKARLTTLNPTAYTAARLRAMTVNDIIYALRLSSSDNAGIK